VPGKALAAPPPAAGSDSNQPNGWIQFCLYILRLPPLRRSGAASTTGNPSLGLAMAFRRMSPRNG